MPDIVDAYLANKMHEAIKTAVHLQSKRLRDEAQAENANFLNKLDDNIKKIIKDQVKEQVKAQVSKILPKIEKTVNEQLEAEVLTCSSNMAQSGIGLEDVQTCYHSTFMFSINMSSNTPDYIYPIIVPSDYDVENAFSSTHSPNYTPASPNYFPASPGNTPSDSLDDLTKDLLASLAISPFHDDPYMKVMQAYNSTSNESPIPPPQAHIAPPTVLPPSLVLPLSPMFDPQDFFLPEEILPPQK
ncbi:hypothetical protein Tco_1274002 [Tanacetum coccineum]